MPAPPASDDSATQHKEVDASSHVSGPGAQEAAQATSYEWWDDDDFDESLEILAVDDADAEPTDGDARIPEDALLNQLVEQVMDRANWNDGKQTLELILDRRVPWPLARHIVKKARRGMSGDELAAVWALREHWMANYVDVSNYALTWDCAIALVRAFDGCPDDTELTEFVDGLYDSYRHSPSRRMFRDFGMYMWHLLEDDFGGAPFHLRALETSTQTWYG